MFFLQMAGFPGSGKSTLSRAIAKHTSAVIIDHDIVKSALLQALETHHVQTDAAGHISYSIEWSLIDFHLSQGHNVILDSPCFYEEMLDKGQSLCEKHRAQYKYIECYLNDRKEINRRLKIRVRMISQIAEIASEAGFNSWINNSKKPERTPYLVVDSGKPLHTYINDVLTYINN